MFHEAAAGNGPMAPVDVPSVPMTRKALRSRRLCAGLLIATMAAALPLFARPGIAAEALITSATYPNGDIVPYVLNSEGPAPRYVIILFPGGSGNMDPRMVDGRIEYGFRGNFLIRVRPLIVDSEFATVSTNTTRSPERIQALLDDLKRRFPAAHVYLMGTSNGSDATMRLAAYLSERIAGVIHTSSPPSIRDLDGRQFKNRQLLVHHRNDDCRYTPFAAARASHERFGTELIVMQGGIRSGDPCEPYGHHGFNGIERETVEAIKGWVRGEPRQASP